MVTEVNVGEIADALRLMAARMRGDQSGSPGDWAGDVEQVADRLSRADVVWTPSRVDEADAAVDAAIYEWAEKYPP